MDLEIELGCGRRELIIGEDTPLSLGVASAAGQAITVPDPRRSPDWPKVRVRDLARGTERAYGPHDLERQKVHEFLPPPRPVSATLAPGEAVRWEDRLLRWVEIPRAGTYDLTLLMQGPRGVVSSAPVPLRVLPLKLVSAEITAADGAGHPLRYCAWCHDAGERGALLFLGATNLGDDGPVFVQADRVAEIDAPVSPVPSASPPRALFPAHWVAFLSPRGLEGQYVLQRKPGPAALPGKPEAAADRILGPGLLDPAGATALRPARAHVAIWAPGRDRARLLLHTFEADGQVAGGQGVDVAPGALRWGAATELADGEGRFALVVRRDDVTDLEVLLHARGGAPPMPAVNVARWRGEAIGAGMTLTGDGAMIGAVVVREGLGSAIAPWAVARDGTATLPPAVAIRAGLPIDRAFVAVSPSGQVLVMAQTAGGGWVHGGRDGILRPLPDEAAAFGVPIGAELSTLDAPFAVMAGAETGITYQALSGHGHP